MDLLNNKELGAEIYRTDKDGDILVKSDGKQISMLGVIQTSIRLEKKLY